MKYSIFSLFLALIVFSCGGPKGEKVESGEAMAEQGKAVASAGYVVDPAMSSINWKGTKLIGGGHEGTINVLEGKLAVANGVIVGGDFSIDMNSIACTDLTADDGKADLEGHLKNGDFFDVAKFPIAKFTVMSAQAIPDAVAGGPTHKVMGNLTMKEQTRSVAIPVIISMDGDVLKATAPDFVIDRTEWGVEHNAPGIEGVAKNRIINKNIGLSFTVVAKK